MVMTILMVTITLVQFELDTTVCSSVGLIYSPNMKQTITHEFSLQIPSRFLLYPAVHSLESFKKERELHNYNTSHPYAVDTCTFCF